MPPIDEARLHEFVGKMLGDLGGAMSVPTVRIGQRLGLFAALVERPLTAAQLAAQAGGLHERYVREWALAQAANGYVTFDPAAQTFVLSPEQAMVFATPPEIQVEDLPPQVSGAKPKENTFQIPSGDIGLNDFLENAERQMILRAYERANGVKTECAKILKIKTSALYYKLEKYGIQ